MPLKSATKDLTTRVLPLAGIVQSAYLVTGIANTGMIAQDSLVKTLNCIFIQNPESISEVYQGTQDIEIGLGLLSTLLTNIDLQQHAEIVRYSLSLMDMERKFAKNPTLSHHLSSGIQKILTQRKSEENLWIESLADLYEETIGQLHPRIQVTGDQQHLQNPINIQRIRALLLAGLRSAVLWRQLGGRQWQLVLSKKSMKAALSKLT
ncbi:MAG: high frequency lysogenization protein HflD [Pseudomonadales bacterium]|nr:high frequency lysogenization protein HflD [Pseudomonadales bacterium]